MNSKVITKDTLVDFLLTTKKSQETGITKAQLNSIPMEFLSDLIVEEPMLHADFVEMYGTSLKISSETLVPGFNRIPNNIVTPSLIDALLKNGQIIIEATVYENLESVVCVTSYGCDYNRDFYMACFGMPREKYTNSIIVETLNPYYEFKDNSPQYGKSLGLVCKTPISIEEDHQDIRSWDNAVRVICYSASPDYLKGLPNTHDAHGEVYVSKGYGDFPNFGGPLEIEFATDLMKAKGYYVPEIHDKK